jgi:hypothetical protein
MNVYYLNTVKTMIDQKRCNTEKTGITDLV